MVDTYKTGVVGGTFDHFHEGHKALLASALGKSERVFIGVATSKLTQQKQFFSTIETYDIREKAVAAFVRKHKAENRVKIIPINDLYGNTLQDKNIDAIFVTEETKCVVPLINTHRQRIGMKELAVVEVPFVLADDGNPISSERIRKGEIDRKGYVYLQHLLKKKVYHLPEEIRDDLRKPFGVIYKDVTDIFSLGKVPVLIAVGDIVSLSLYKHDHPADITIIDLKNRRTSLRDEDIKMLQQRESIISVQNEAGMITKDANETIANAIHTYLEKGKKQAIIVHGEEDLLVLPAILLAPLGGIILYGQFGKGVICVPITEEKKAEAVSLCKRFR